MTDTNQDPNYQDILAKYADSLKSTEVPKIPEPEAKSQASPETQLDSVPEVKPEEAPVAPPTALEPDLEAEDIPDTEPQTAVMTEMDAKTEVTPIVSPKSTDEGGISASDMLETEDQIVTPAPVEPEAPKITQPDVQVPPSMMETPPMDVVPPTPPVDDFVPPAPHNIEIAPDLVPPPKENHFFKYLFFFSLVVFIVVAALVAYSFVNSQKTLNDLKATPTTAPPTGALTKACEINGQEYAVNETFTATDGCNTCSCTADLTIVCTEMACDASKSATISGTPTKAATVSATKAPTATTAPKATIIP
jgi:hypothetical protein